MAHAVKNRRLVVGKCGERTSLGQDKQETDLNDHFGAATICGD